ncbi:hypothetical protein Goshw_008161, partial [Gossypium schwendimanii]|nr:hypothetical protein [Gossypium schwendimanii]
MACGSYYCSECKFIIHVNCALQEVDGHCLVLTFHEDTDYSEYLYCDICEKQRSPCTWFYHCVICDNSAHLHCVVGDHPFIKRGMTFIESDHPQVLVFVEKVYDYPRCCNCGQHCLDLAIECSDAECKYIIHWSCSTLYNRLL